MTNDAIKKMKNEALANWIAKWKVTTPQPAANFLDGFESGFSVHAKLLSEKGVEGARRWFVTKTFDLRSPACDYPEKIHRRKPQWSEFELVSGKIVVTEVLEALPALHKIEQLERQLAKCKIQRNDKCVGLNGFDTDWKLIEAYDAELSELDGK